MAAARDYRTGALGPNQYTQIAFEGVVMGAQYGAARMAVRLFDV
jgi:hypothetical protein